MAKRDIRNLRVTCYDHDMGRTSVGWEEGRAGFHIWIDPVKDYAVSPFCGDIYKNPLSGAWTLPSQQTPR